MNSTRRTLRRAAVLAALALSLLAFGCGSDGKSASDDDSGAASSKSAGLEDSSYDDPESVATALGCTDYEHEPKEDQQFSVADEGGCEFDGEFVSIYMFKDKEQQRNWIGLGEGLGCSMAEGFGVTSFSYVVGENWIIQPETKTAAELVADTVGGNLRTTDCDE